MNRPKRKKLYYVPGILSLAILPIAFYCFAKGRIQHLKKFAIPVYWADTSFMRSNDVIFSNFHGYFPPKRVYTNITFTGDQQGDKVKLEFAQIRIREILKAGDTLNGLHLVFGDGSNYGTFVSAIDRLRLEGAKTYMPLENNVWFYHFQPSATIESMVYDCLLCNDVLYVKPFVPWWRQTKQAIIGYWNSSWQVMILYCSFLTSVVVLKRKKNGS